MSAGWFPMWRSTWDSYINDLPEGQRWVAATLFMLVATKAKRRRAGAEMITVKPGQVFVTLRKLATRANVSKGVAERAVRALVKGNTITLEAGRNGMLITLRSYDDFKLDSHDARDDSETDAGHAQDTNGTPRGTPRGTGSNEVRNKNKTIARNRAPKAAGYAETVDVFDRLYREHHADAKPTWGGKQGKLLSGLLKAHGADEVQRRIRVLFTAAPDWIESRDVGTLVQHFDKLASKQGQRRNCEWTPFRPYAGRGA